MIRRVCLPDRIFRFLYRRGGTWIEDGLGDEEGHDLSQGGIIFPAAVQDILDYFSQLVHGYLLSV